MPANDDATPFTGGSLGLYDLTGHRKYLTNNERSAFLSATEQAPREVRTFCGMLAYTGCRISEALALTADRIDLQASVIVFETLKKRQPGIYRAVPVSDSLIEVVDLVHGVRDAQARRDGGRKHRLWPWSRMTGWRRVIEVMVRADITGPHATPWI